MPLYPLRHALVDLGEDPTGFLLLWLTVVVGLGLPLGVGVVLGGLYATRRTREGWDVVRRRLPPDRERRLLALVGRRPPRAWDHVFADGAPRFLRVALANGTVVAGRYGADAYAGRFPHEGDLYLDEVWPLCADGTFGDAPLDYGQYLPAATILSIEIVEPAFRKEDTRGA